ncbi:M56 family metallopeptidase [Spirosoma radiotolerans]|uniref:Peptidase M56 domain-containing protein n=1 Tax=Spirosoma radiotolerans TaxID=1379870 RepID=A0A0E3ZZU0_9BACT|nr:M56 family metallopeptidase [Spirosoma radiotolerans]AKD57859.1 hypothetical protein SD10_26110 [Spirosoma radiotolerans]
MNSFNFLSSPVADALGWTLLHAVWQGFALVLPAAVALHLLRSRSSALRYRIGTFTLLSQLLVSTATFIWCYTPVATIHSSTSVMMTVQALPVRWQSVAQTLPWHQQMQLFLANHLGQFVLMYLIGVALFGLRLAGGWLYLQRLTQTATQPAASICLQLANRIRSTLAIKIVVQVRESARTTVPMVVGVLKPVLLLPVGLVTNLTSREIEAVLAHELAHIKRHDYAVNLLQSVVEVLYFFHPALWWLSARVREEREHCCDDLAVQACGGDGRILAQALAHVEELRLTPAPSAPALAMALTTNRQQLLHRVQRMLGVPTRPFVSNGSLAGLTLATILLMSISVYAMQKQNQPKPTKSSSPSTRRHKTGNGSEFSMIDNKKVDYIIWKGQKLPASRIARLQKQFDLVMSGQLSLDAVKQPDRDILLTIIETNQGHQEGMEALAEGLSHIDYSNIVASALKNVPLSPDGTVEGLAKVDYDSIINNAFASLPTLNALSDSHDKLNQRLLDTDSLPEEFHNKFLDLKLKYDQLHSQLTANEKAMEDYIAKMREPSNQRQRLYLEQRKLQEEMAYLQKQASRADFRTLNDALLAEMATAERNLSEARKRLNEFTYKEINPYSDSLSKTFKRLRRLRDSIRINEEQIIRLTPEALETPEPPKANIHTPRGVIAPAAPIPPAASVRAIPAPKPAPAAPALAPTPAVPATSIRGRRMATPKPALPPVPERP